MKIIINEDARVAGKVADAEIHFTDGPLAGYKLIGFGIWTRRTGDGYNVTFPARQYSVNGERRSFALLRPCEGTPPEPNAIRDTILAAYHKHVDATSIVRTENSGSA